MRIVFFGSGAFGVPTFDRLMNQHEVALVVTQPDRPAGRHRVLTATPVAAMAAAQKPAPPVPVPVPVIKPENVNDPSVIERIRKTEADALVVIAFGQKLDRQLWSDTFAINLHASLLPKYRGAAPINWAMINGEAETGLSVITLADRMDSGDVLAQQRVAIDPHETAGELHDRLASMGPNLMSAVLDRKVEGRLEPQAQDERLVTKAPKLSKADGTVCFDQPAERVRNRVHGLTPWPGCWIRIGERSLRLHRVEVLSQDQSKNAEVSEVSEVSWGTLLEDRCIACAPGTGWVRPLEVQPPNGKLMTFQAYCNGHGVRPGERFQPA